MPTPWRDCLALQLWRRPPPCRWGTRNAWSLHWPVSLSFQRAETQWAGVCCKRELRWPCLRWRVDRRRWSRSRRFSQSQRERGHGPAHHLARRCWLLIPQKQWLFKEVPQSWFRCRDPTGHARYCPRHRVHSGDSFPLILESKREWRCFHMIHRSLSYLSKNQQDKVRGHSSAAETEGARSHRYKTEIFLASHVN
jgi:hypothetical protein